MKNQFFIQHSEIIWFSEGKLSLLLIGPDSALEAQRDISLDHDVEFIRPNWDKSAIWVIKKECIIEILDARSLETIELQDLKPLGIQEIIDAIQINDTQWLLTDGWGWEELYKNFFLMEFNQPASIVSSLKTNSEFVSSFCLSHTHKYLLHRDSGQGHSDWILRKTDDLYQKKDHAARVIGGTIDTAIFNKKESGFFVAKIDGYYKLSVTSWSIDDSSELKIYENWGRELEEYKQGEIKSMAINICLLNKYVFLLSVGAKVFVMSVSGDVLDKILFSKNILQMAFIPTHNKLLIMTEQNLEYIEYDFSTLLSSASFTPNNKQNSNEKKNSTTSNASSNISLFRRFMLIILKLMRVS